MSPSGPRGRLLEKVQVLAPAQTPQGWKRKSTLKFAAIGVEFARIRAELGSIWRESDPFSGLVQKWVTGKVLI